MKKYLVEALKIQNDIGIKDSFDFIIGREFEIRSSKKDNSIKSNNITTDTKKQIQSNYNKSEVLKLSSIADIVNAVSNFNGCELKRTANKDVIFDGNIKGKIMLIGEAPGEEEDESGIPFCGKSGKLLTKALSCINLRREDNLFITNTVFWRPPDNRKPTKAEIELCRPFIDSMIDILNPNIIISCGSVATKMLLDSDQNISSMMGSFFDYNNNKNIIKVFPIFHPSYLVRNPIAKKQVWSALLKLKNLTDSL